MASAGGDVVGDDWDDFGVGFNADSTLVLFGGDVLHPVDDLAVESFLNGDVSHAGDGCGSVPRLLSRCERHDISWVNLLDGTAFALRPSAACGDDEGLAEWVGVPCGAGSGLEGNAGAGYQRGVGCLKEGVDTDGAGKPVCWAFA